MCKTTSAKLMEEQKQSNVNKKFVSISKDQRDVRSMQSAEDQGGEFNFTSMRTASIFSIEHLIKKE